MNFSLQVMLFQGTSIAMMMILSMPGIQGSKIVWYPQTDESKNYNADHLNFMLLLQQSHILPNHLVYLISPQKKPCICKIDK